MIPKLCIPEIVRSWIVPGIDGLEVIIDRDVTAIMLLVCGCAGMFGLSGMRLPESDAGTGCPVLSYCAPGRFPVSFSVMRRD